jgi:hypothetical protein
VRESANLACYAIVYAKGMVPKDKLDQAMMKSVGEGAPLEQVLVQMNALKPGAVDDLIKARNRLGRHCVKCGDQTFLLQDQNETNTKCEDEKCGGKLLTAAEWTARQKPLPNLRPAGATPVHGVKTGDGGAAFEGRIARLEAALKALEEKAGKPDPNALARAAEHAEKVLAPRLDAARKEAAMAIREAAAAKEASEKASQQAGKATASVAEGLGVSDLADLPGHLAEQLTPRIVQAVRGRLDELSGLGDRVTALEAGGGGGGGGGVDPSVVAAQVTSAVAAQVTEALEGRLADLERRVTQADGWAEKVAAGLKKIPDEGKLIEKVAEKVKAGLPPPAPAPDADELIERTARAVLSSVDERLAQGVAEAQGTAQASARDAVRPLEARLVEVEARPTPAPGPDERMIERLAEVEARADREELALGKRLTQLEESLAATATAASKPGGVDDAALEAKLAGVEERIGAAQADVLEALNGRVEELAKSLDGLPAKAAKDAVAAVKERLEQLDDPRELMGRAATQATKDALAAVEKRLEKLGQGGAPAAAPAAGAARADLDKLQVGLDELKETIELLQARMDAQRARQQQAPAQASDELVARVQEGVLATVGERMLALEARLAETSARSTTSDASVSGVGGAAPNADAVVQQAVQAVWDQLEPLDLPGLPQRTTDLVTQKVMAQIDESLAGLPERLAASAAAPVMASIEARLAKLDLKNLPRKIAADVKAELGQNGGGGDAPAVDEAGLTARILEQVDQRLADRPAAPEGGGNGVDLDQVREVAREVAAEIVAESQAQSGGAAAPSGNGDGAPSGGDAGDGGKTEKRLAAMARALKELKDDFDGVKEQVGTLADRPPVGEAAPAAGPVPRELIAFLNSVEFKEVFDKRINEVLRYVKNDLVPSAVKKAVDAASAAGSS